MRYLILVVLFLIMPYVLLNMYVVPALGNLKTFYANSESIAIKAAGIDQPR